ncbi:MAG: glyceraldehyde-3-phosphate dehydrogenase [Porticoccaceae bacterium]|nr:MAG: glyceraldehyde-3-phosphate dehydrogenase [Porticoccaceae bacterium]
MASVRVGINGFGRIGRLVTRILWECPEVEIARINDPGGDAAVLAHLLNFDSIHGRWRHEARAEGDALVVAGRRVAVSGHPTIPETDWSGCDYVLECSGKMRRRELLEAYLQQGVRRVLVSAPVSDPEVVNIVRGVNDHAYDPARHRLLSAASCTTNCLAPVVKVIHGALGIRHGSITTIHALTPSQVVLDKPGKDLRRIRAAGESLIPTTTGAASAIGAIFPELAGRLDGRAVRVPLEKVSLTDCVFEVARSTTAEEVNRLLREAAEGELAGILGYEERPLVSIDFRGDPRSAIVDAGSTLVVGGTQVKVYAWYDNEWGYSNRLAELLREVAARDRGQ